MTTRPKLILIGAGGHARSCIDVIEDSNKFEIAGLIVDKSNKLDGQVGGYPKIGYDSELSRLRDNYDHALIAVGQIHSAHLRKFLFNKLQELRYISPAIISLRAYASRHAKIGAGSIVMHGAIVNSGVKIGENCIINSMSLVEHDADIGDHCHISTGARINGNVIIGSNSFIASGAVVKNGVKIGSNCFIGMGAIVTNDLSDNIKFLAGS